MKNLDTTLITLALYSLQEIVEDKKSLLHSEARLKRIQKQIDFIKKIELKELKSMKAKIEFKHRKLK